MVSESSGAQPSGLGAAAKFNPHLWKPDELRAIFVARQTELAELVRRVRHARPGVPPQHVLITGHRGMGKSTLLHRLALAVEDDPALRREWVPLLFREEQYTAVTLDKFWRNAIDALTEALDRRVAGEPSLSADMRSLDAINAALDREPSAAVREQQALAALHEWSERHACRLLLLVDSTEQLFEALAHGKATGDKALWRLRECLTQDERFFWISCAYAPLEAQHDYEHPFHEFFAQLPLKPLNADDMRSAFLALARTFGAGRGLPPEQAEDHIQALLQQQPERLETLLRLAGGNPRTTVLLYQLLVAGGHDSVHSDLQRLLDEMSPLYKDRLEHQLAVQPRQLVATLMENWAPMAAKAVALAANLPVTQVNAQLSRLEAGGWVERVRLAGTRRHGYQVAERFFNVWYLMRLAPRRLRLRLSWLVEFMRVWFSADERATMAAQRASFHRDGQSGDERQLEYSRALALSLDMHSPARAQLDLALYAKTTRGRVGELVLFEPDGEDQPFASIDDYRACFDGLRAKLMQVRHREDQGFDRQAFVSGVLGSLSLSLQEKDRVASAAGWLSRFQCDELCKVFADERKSWASDYVGEDALRNLIKLVERGEYFPDTPDVQLALTQARAWLHSVPDAFALALVIAARELDPVRLELVAKELDKLELTREARTHLRCDVANTLSGTRRFKGAEAAYRKAIELDPASALSWNGLGNLLQAHLKRYDDSEAAYRKAIELDPSSAWPWNGLGNLLQAHLKRYDDSEAAYRKAIELDPSSAWPWNGLGNLLQDHLKRYDEAEEAYRKAIELNPSSAWPWNGLGNLLKNHLENYDEAEAAYRRAIELDPAIARPWNGLGNLLQDHLKRYYEAEAAYRKAIELDPSSAWPWNGLGNLLKNHLENYDEAEAAYRRAIELDPANASPWNNLGNLMQDRFERGEEAASAYREAIRRDAQDPYPVANLARWLAEAGRGDEARAQYLKVLDLLAAGSDGSWRMAGHDLAFQAHLALGNNTAAAAALALITAELVSDTGGAQAQFVIAEQAFECHRAGLGLAMAELLAQDTQADRLKPIELALRHANGRADELWDQPAELQAMALEIAKEWPAKQSASSGRPPRSARARRS